MTDSSNGGARSEEGGLQSFSSPSSILDHLCALTESLEKVWSAAQETEEVQAVRTEFTTLWSVFLESLSSRSKWIAKYDESLNLLAVGLPLSDQQVSELRITLATTEQRYRQLQFAAFYTTVDYIEALSGMIKPSNATLRISSNGAAQIESWWSGSAFALLQRQAQSLSRILREQDECLIELLAGYSDEANLPFQAATTSYTWPDLLNNASEICSSGHADASLFPLLQATRSIVSHVSNVDLTKLPVPLSAHLPDAGEMSHFGSQVALLEDSVRRLSRGEAIEPGASLLISKRLQQRLKKLIVSPPPAEIWNPLRGNVDV